MSPGKGAPEGSFSPETVTFRNVHTGAVSTYPAELAPWGDEALVEIDPAVVDAAIYARAVEEREKYDAYVAGQAAAQVEVEAGRARARAQAYAEARAMGFSPVAAAGIVGASADDAAALELAHSKTASAAEQERAARAAAEAEQRRLVAEEVERVLRDQGRLVSPTAPVVENDPSSGAGGRRDAPGRPDPRQARMDKAAMRRAQARPPVEG